MPSRIAIGILVLGLTGSLARAEDQVGESPFQPTRIGTTWTYTGGGKTVINTIAKHERQSGKMCLRLETFVDGKAASVEHIAIDRDGVKRMSYNGQVPDQPVTILKLPVTPGESWKVAITTDGELAQGEFTSDNETITVPAGTFETVKVSGDVDVNGQATRLTYWIAEKKGIVKLALNKAGKEVFLELERFDEGL